MSEAQRPILQATVVLQLTSGDAPTLEFNPELCPFFFPGNGLLSRLQAASVRPSHCVKPTLLANASVRPFHPARKCLRNLNGK